MKISNWKKLNESLAYDGWRQIIQKRFELPDGQIADFDIIGNKAFVSIAAFTESREAILVRQYRPGPEKMLLSFPEGYIDPGELPEETARRELLEETGFKAGHVQLLKKFYRAYSTEERYVLLATNCHPASTSATTDAEEFIEVLTLPIPQLRQLLLDPKESSFTNTGTAYLALDWLGWL